MLLCSPFAQLLLYLENSWPERSVHSINMFAMLLTTASETYLTSFSFSNCATTLQTILSTGLLCIAKGKKSNMSKNVCYSCDIEAATTGVGNKHGKGAAYRNGGTGMSQIARSRQEPQRKDEYHVIVAKRAIRRDHFHGGICEKRLDGAKKVTGRKRIGPGTLRLRRTLCVRLHRVCARLPWRRRHTKSSLENMSSTGTPPNCMHCASMSSEESKTMRSPSL